MENEKHMYQAQSPRIHTVLHHCVENTEPSKTRQEFAEDSDINTIMARWTVQRGPDYRDIRSDWQRGTYGDFSNAVDLTAALSMADEARKSFELLPSAVRAAAGHDPVRFLEMVGDADQVQELVKHGLEIEGAPQAAREPAQEPSSEPASAPAPPPEEAPPAAE